MCYPGLNSSSKMHLFRSICQTTLMYGVECLNISSKHVNILNSAQGSVVKHVHVHVSGLSVRARHTALLQDVCVYFTQMYISSGIRVPGSLVVIEFGVSPLYINHNFSPPTYESNGVVDSLRAMLLSENYVKPWYICLSSS